MPPRMDHLLCRVEGREGRRAPAWVRSGTSLGATAALMLLTSVAGAAAAAGTAAVAAAVEAELGVAVLAFDAGSQEGSLPDQGPWPRRGRLWRALHGRR